MFYINPEELHFHITHTASPQRRALPLTANTTDLGPSFRIMNQNVALQRGKQEDLLCGRSSGVELETLVDSGYERDSVQTPS